MRDCWAYCWWRPACWRRLSHLEAFKLPGCGSASDCTRAAASRWGKLPGSDWPLSFVGFAYFQALAAALLYSGGRLPRMLRAVMVVAAVVSVLLVGVMLAKDYLCGYCVTIHTLNLALVGWYEVQNRRSPAQPTPASPHVTVGWFAATFAATSLLLAIVDQQFTLAAEQVTQTRLKQAVEQANSSDRSPGQPVAQFGPGRFHLGPESAKVHITVVSDYQCPSCRRIDAQLRWLVGDRDDVSVSARHFPFCTDCNGHIDKTRHPNACRSAVAAEAAGIAGETDAFWQMHNWLFERSGSFTDEELVRFVAEAQIPEVAFREALASAETIELIRADAGAADAAGLKFTPMVFINGAPIDVGK